MITLKNHLKPITMKLTVKLALLGFLLINIACSPQEKEAQKNTEAFDKAEAEVAEKVKEVIAEMPAPSEIPYLLMETGAEYNPSLLHDLKRMKSYTSSDKAALNLGIYATDVAYLSTYNKSQEALKYVSEIKPMADQLSLSSAFSPSTIARFEGNLGNTDSLVNIINNAVTHADNHLKSTNRPKVAALLLAGSFVEGLYIATALIENYPDDLLPEDVKTLILIPLVDVVLKQEEPLIDLIALLKSVDKDEAISKIVGDLNELKEEYKNLNVKQIMDDGRGDLLLKDEALDKLTNKVGMIRDNITG
ncbi:MAG: hypothetical protein ACJAT1_000769 [Marivirga sp.]|jgi:hypothetical protein